MQDGGAGAREIAAERGAALTVAKLDVDANPETARDFQVVSIPTVILFKDGQPVKRIVGAKGRQHYCASSRRGSQPQLAAEDSGQGSRCHR